MLLLKPSLLRQVRRCVVTGRRHQSTCMSASTEHLLRSLRGGDVLEKRRALAKAITLVESTLPSHQEQANLLLSNLSSSSPSRKQAFRLGIAGPPGAGKSTLIETFGTKLLEEEKIEKLAVVCIDPSSTITGGSILGDKTRMWHLSRHERAYIRPSANGGSFGGLAAYTDDVVSLVKAADYDFVVVETVGLGQSEVEVAQSVDMLLLVLPPSGGDELQGVKKGIMEVSDLIVVNKADGNLLQAARRTAVDYKSAANVGMSPSRHAEWPVPPVLLVSAHEGTGLDELWKDVDRYRTLMMENGTLQKQRKEQARYWMWKNLQKLILEQTSRGCSTLAQELEQRLDEGALTPRIAAQLLMDSIRIRK